MWCKGWVHPFCGEDLNGRRTLAQNTCTTNPAVERSNRVRPLQTKGAQPAGTKVVIGSRSSPYGAEGPWIPGCRVSQQTHSASAVVRRGRRAADSGSSVAAVVVCLFAANYNWGIPVN